jgi:D-glycero-D-manno-heptose 1,7-bisphosphate phosphatase
MLKLIVLDRDGVINYDSKEFIKSPAEWRAIPGSLNAIAKLTKAGYKIIIASNQSGVARGLFTIEELHKINQKMLQEIEAVGGKIEEIFICPHGPEDNCDCRKPKPGLLKKIAEKYLVKPEEMLIIGDSMRDILAAKANGSPALLVETGNGKETLCLLDDSYADVSIFRDLEAAADAIIEKI